jgi:ppGpp synthetase/RelA/SpoT-type nucleotidyltranferase
VVVNHDGKLIEIQVRTSLQQVWAELSEKFSDVIDPSIKYGGGDAVIQQLLQITSKLIANEELDEKLIDDLIAVSKNQMSSDLMQKIDNSKKRLKQERLRVYKDLVSFSDEVLKLKEERQ